MGRHVKARPARFKHVAQIHAARSRPVNYGRPVDQGRLARVRPAGPAKPALNPVFHRDVNRPVITVAYVVLRDNVAKPQAASALKRLQATIALSRLPGILAIHVRPAVVIVEDP
jgi:hypothetical protein